MIQFKNVSLILGGKTILHPLNLSLASQQTHVILGSSGCGKSTLLKLILGIHSPTTGEVSIGKKTQSNERQREIAKTIGYVVQEGGLFPHLSIEENVTLMARLENWDKNKIKERLFELAELTHLDPQLFKKFPARVSGGQKQRASLMRALFMNPDIMLMDEPLGALDPIVRSELQEELKDIFNRLKKTVLIVTHDLGEAAHFGHSIVLMSEGKVEQVGEFADLVEHPKSEFVERFINAQRPNPYLEGAR